MNEPLFPGGVDAAGMPLALHDPQRLAAVAATGLLDTDPEPAFEGLAELAAALTGCSRAFITLVDEERSFWKSCVGVDAREIADRQGRVEDSFCYFLIGLGDVFAVTDAATDPRTCDHPSVKPMKIGAWAGYPILSTGGQVLGSMCVIDENPHAWQPAELGALATMARAVSNEMNLRRTLVLAQESLQLSRDLARSLQDSLLPPVLEPVPGLEVSASYVPAAGGTDVVGDFYDLFHVRGSWWCAAIGDVCGKGTEAAKVTALARYTLRAAASHHLSPAAILRDLNTALIDQYRDGRLVTAAGRHLPDFSRRDVRPDLRGGSSARADPAGRRHRQGDRPARHAARLHLRRQADRDPVPAQGRRYAPALHRRCHRGAEACGGRVRGAPLLRRGSPGPGAR